MAPLAALARQVSTSASQCPCRALAVWISCTWDCAALHHCTIWAERLVQLTDPGLQDEARGTAQAGAHQQAWQRAACARWLGHV